MKKLYLAVFLFIIFIVTLFAEAYLRDFRGFSEGDNVRIEWETAEESNLNHFTIERRTPQSSFIEIATIQPKGSNSFYSYLDESAYKQNDFIFIYQIKIVDNSGSITRSSEISVTPNISGFKRTWGSIKAMFR